MFAGSSSGTLLAAALRYCRAQSEPKRVVSFVCDSGAKYLSKVFNDAFLAQEGLLGRERTGTVRDLVINPHAEGAAVEVRPEDNLRTVFARMRAADVSQLPVLARRAHRRPGRRERYARRSADRTSGRQRVRPAGQGHHGDAAGDDFGRRADPRTRAAVPRRTMSRSSWTASDSSASSPASISSIISGLHCNDQTEPPGLRHPLRACRAGARSDDRRRDDADLRHLDLRAGKPRRAQRLRICAHPKSDPHGVRALRRRSRRRRAGLCLRVGARRDRDHPGMPRPGRACRRVRRSLWRHAAAVRARAQALGRDRSDLCRSDRCQGARSRDPAEHETDLGRDADQSAAQADRSARASPISRASARS